MERPIFKPVGTPVEQLDTPALVLDLDVLERNIETVHSFFRQRPANLRPHVEAHRCPAIAHKQLAAGDGGQHLAALRRVDYFFVVGDYPRHKITVSIIQLLVGGKSPNEPTGPVAKHIPQSITKADSMLPQLSTSYL